MEAFTFEVLSCLTNRLAHCDSCSCDMNYETDNNLLPLFVVECDKNVPKVITILPYAMDTEKILAGKK